MRQLEFLFLAFMLAADPVPVKSPFPSFPQPVAPQPKSDPAAPVKLPVGKLLIVQSDEPFLLFETELGAVKVTRKTGPVTVYGEFIDGPDEERTITAKHIAIVRAVPGVNEDVSLIYSKVGETNEANSIRLKLQVGSGRGAKPPPIVVDPKVDPVKAAKVKVLVVEDEKGRAKLPAAKLNILFSPEFRSFLDTVTPLNTELKQHEWYIVDKDIDMADAGETFAAMRKAATGPWTIVVVDAATGKVLANTALPNNVADTIALVKRYVQ